jgi:hypothetical protein
MAKGLEGRNDVRNQAIVNLQAENETLRNDLRKAIDEKNDHHVAQLIAEAQRDNLLEDVRLYKVALNTLRSILEVAEMP